MNLNELENENNTQLLMYESADGITKEDALDSLGEVTGDVTPDDVLGSIFANFCVGK